MMRTLKWTNHAYTDLRRLYEFLGAVNQPAAIRVVQSLTNGPDILLTDPRIGEQLFEFDPREVRRLFVGKYEVRYEICEATIYILRLWHNREQHK